MNILITGSKSGIGRATALHLARQGHNVYASMRDRQAATDLEAEAKAENLRLKVIEIDVNDEASVNGGVDAVLCDAGHIDVLVNNAGLSRLAAIEETSDEEIRRLFETNFLGPMRAIRAVLPSMRAQRSGVIVNISSLLGRLVISPTGPYAASKYALEAASEALAQEMRPFSVRVAIVEPGLVITPMLRQRAFTPPVESPYADQYRRAGAILRYMASLHISPEDVAVIIEEAICSDEPKLRYVVNNDVNALLQCRLNMSDEEWLGPDRRLTDEEWFYLAEAAMGVDFRPPSRRRAA